MALSRLRRSLLMLGLAIAVSVAFTLKVHAQNDSDHGKGLDIKSSYGDAHVGNDADPRETGLPVFPHAKLRRHDDSRNSANLSIFTTGFGIKLVVLNYDSEAAPDKVVAYYRDKLKKYGKVLECHQKDSKSDLNLSQDDQDSGKTKELKCEGDDSGPVVELKVGTEEDQHIVAIAPAENGDGSTFALVYLHTRGKQGDI